MHSGHCHTRDPHVVPRRRIRCVSVDRALWVSIAKCEREQSGLRVTASLHTPCSSPASPSPIPPPPPRPPSPIPPPPTSIAITHTPTPHFHPYPHPDLHFCLCASAAALRRRCMEQVERASKYTCVTVVQKCATSTLQWSPTSTHTFTHAFTCTSTHIHTRMHLHLGMSDF